jgi:MFS family permease
MFILILEPRLLTVANSTCSMSEIAPKKVRGMIIAGYQFCLTIGLLLASCVTYATENLLDSRSYRIPIGIQWVWAIILCKFFFST